MAKDTLDTLVENLFELGPILHKKLLKPNKCSNDMMLPVNQMMVLSTLYDEGSLPISEIGKKLYISKPQMTSIIDKLIKEDLVERIHDKEDRRVININITEKGKNYANDILKLLREEMRKRLSALSEENLKSVADSMENVISILRGIN
ncbi:MarR family transcriptional regulator [Clostridium sp. CX1]|uniref:MarR family transcriptional regulator n=1 Tax=Clostridium tanneri TaxID=3037988 RepID=A0ABU4JWR9_9CLOT|nr:MULTISPECIES: MarR family transcriptional regulator [unclassified Clostridium]MCT8975023.1 MarR family transcriptional regulator [Clostridium sp. CX1]MDW8802607.1 MarR family transcriptional regulator [Clostridium sp. A1-XYC3]